MNRFLSSLILVFIFISASAQKKKQAKLPDPSKYAATITTED
ncbi:MAG: hypothetical protein RIT36_859, partial [Bacteroidota bacterium]